MKIRNHRNTEYWFRPHETSSLKKHLYIFKYKSYLMEFLNNNFEGALGGVISKCERSFGGSMTLRRWFVWYNQKAYNNGAKLKIELRQSYFRGRKYVSKPPKISKSSKKYFAFSSKVINLMCNIEQSDGIILSKDAKRLTELFYKRGFKDFEPSDDDLSYIDGHISDGIDFSHWSDRCNLLRTKTVIEYFKRKNLI